MKATGCLLLVTLFQRICVGTTRPRSFDQWVKGHEELASKVDSVEAGVREYYAPTLGGMPAAERQIEDVPPPPARLNAESLAEWIAAAIENTTTVLIVWNGVNPYKNGGTFDPYFVLQEAMDATPELVVKVLEETLEPRTFPEGFDALSLVVSELQAGGRHLKAIGQAQIFGVPRVAADAVADFLMSDYSSAVKMAEVDVTITLRDPSSVHSQLQPQLQPVRHSTPASGSPAHPPAPSAISASAPSDSEPKISAAKPSAAAPDAPTGSPPIAGRNASSFLSVVE